MGPARMDLRALVDNAGRLLNRGRAVQAEVLFRQLLTTSPRDGHLRVRHAQALQRLGRKAEAATTFRTAARMLADDGHLARAIAAQKLALELSPGDLDAISELISLEVRRSRDQRARHPAPPVVRADEDLAQDAPPKAPLFALPDLVSPPAPSPELPALRAPQAAWLSDEPLPAPLPSGPAVRRLSDRELAVRPALGAQWLLVQSDTPLRTRYVDERALLFQDPRNLA